MKRDIINPWIWQEALGFVHANKVSAANSTLYVSGQTASDTNGDCLHPGDMQGQIDQTLNNIATILEQAAMDFTHVVRLNIYTTDLPALLGCHDHMVQALQQRGCRHAGTLLGITALASPGALVEIEVTAAN